jgi:putative phage-type endonuclease
MKIKDIEKLNESLIPKLGFNLNTVKQGSDEWIKARLGVLTASNASKIIAGEKTATRLTYLSELVAQIATCESHSVSSIAMEWGKEHEKEARQAYCFKKNTNLIELPFIYKDDSMRVGISPDGFSNEDALEIKCPYTSKVFIDFVCFGEIKKEYIAQVQFSMWVTGRDSWDFACYDPRMKVDNLHFVTIERDAKMMQKFDECVPQCINKMDGMLTKLGIEFGYQWS